MAKEEVPEEAVQPKSETPSRRASEASVRRASEQKVSSRRSSAAEEKPSSRKASVAEEQVRKISFADQEAAPPPEEKVEEEKSASRRSSAAEKESPRRPSIEEKVPSRRESIEEKPKKTKGTKTKSKLGRKALKFDISLSISSLLNIFLVYFLNQYIHYNPAGNCSL